jgi:hypothetical protein
MGQQDEHVIRQGCTSNRSIKCITRPYARLDQMWTSKKRREKNIRTQGEQIIKDVRAHTHTHHTHTHTHTHTQSA